MPKELVPFCDAFGADRSAGIVRSVDLAHDAKGVLGELWAQVEVRAYLEQITEGEALGRFALEAVRSKSKK